MGRPPLDNKPTLVRLSPEQRERMEGLVGQRGMAAFIRTAVDNELDRLDAEASLTDDVEDVENDGPTLGR